MYTALALCALIAVPFFAPAALAGGDGGAAARTPADLVLRGGKVLTLAGPTDGPAPTAVAVSGRYIAYVGDDAGVEAWIGDGTRVVDLAGAVVTPGLVDGHAHLYGLGKALSEVDLMGTTSAADCVARAVAAAADLAEGEWLQGRGWDQNDWPLQEFPHRAQLDAVFVDRPVMLRRVDGHAAWCNTAALAAAGIDAATPDPAGGRILRDEAGEATGILIDNGADLVREVIPPVGADEIRRRVRLAVDHCLRLGLTGVHEAGASWERIGIYKEMVAAGDLHLRLYTMLDDVEETLEPGIAAGPYASDDGMLTLRAVKLYADGALGSRGALLLDDYTDEPGNRGLAVSSVEHLRAACLRAGRAGFQVCTHAIGDGANRNVLDVYAEVIAELGLDDARWRVEHAQILAPADIPRFGKLEVIASMQPVHCTSDMDWAPIRLGEERCRQGAYVWRTLQESGAVLSFGTDFPVEKVEPLHGLYSARTRMHHDGTPTGGWYPDECLDGLSALAAYTYGPVYSAFQERQLGAVAPGRLADLTVLSGDPVACAPAELLEMEALLTVVDGVVRFSGF